MSDLILGMDAGNHGVKMASEYGVAMYSSAICNWFSRDVEEVYGSDDAEFEINGRRGYTGTIARYEDEFGESMYGLSKAHEDTLVKVLVSISRYIKERNLSVRTVSLVTGQPIKQHVPKDKEFIVDMLKGKHTFIVNGECFSFTIENVGVCAEGSGAYWSFPEKQSVKIADLGSGTTNLATIRDRKHVNNMSDTVNFGMNTGKNERDVESMVGGVIRATTRLQWGKDDTVYICGGVAEEAIIHMKNHYNNAEVLYPLLEGYEGTSRESPVYANAIGFLKIAQATFR